jgi:hypothetical protein
VTGQDEGDNQLLRDFAREMSEPPSIVTRRANRTCTPGAMRKARLVDPSRGLSPAVSPSLLGKYATPRQLTRASDEERIDATIRPDNGRTRKLRGCLDPAMHTIRMTTDPYDR